MNLNSTKKIASLFFVLATLSGAQADHATAFTGTWKLNVAKSTFGSGPAPASVTITNTADGTFTLEAIDGLGITRKSSHVWSGGVEVAFEGVERATIVSKVRGREMDDTIKIGGKIAETVHAVIAANGKSMTSTTDSTDEYPSGAGHHVLIFERQ